MTYEMLGDAVLAAGIIKTGQGTMEMVTAGVGGKRLKEAAIVNARTQKKLADQMLEYAKIDNKIAQIQGYQTERSTERRKKTIQAVTIGGGILLTLGFLLG